MTAYWFYLLSQLCCFLFVPCGIVLPVTQSYCSLPKRKINCFSFFSSLATDEALSLAGELFLAFEFAAFLPLVSSTFVFLFQKRPMAVVLEASGDDCQRTFDMVPGDGQKALDEPIMSSARTVTRIMLNMVGGDQK